MDALILAGGKNTRFASHKGLAIVGGRRIIETISDLFSSCFSRIFVSTNEPERFFSLGHAMMGDVLDRRGPLTGIYSALVCSGSPELFVAACDMPFIKKEIVRLIVDAYDGQDAVVASFRGRLQPLLGIYSGRIVDRIGERLDQGAASMMGLLEGIDAHVISDEEVARLDPGGSSFVNINTVEEYLHATGG